MTESSGQSGTSSTSGQGSAGSQSGSGGDAKFTQADLDRIVDQRLAREKAKFADYDDLKRKAGEFDRVEADRQKAAAAQKSEAEKMADRIAAAERAAADANVQLLRFKVATEKQVPADLVEFLTATDAKGLAAQADKLMEKVGSSTKTTSFDGGARGGGAAKTTDMNALIRQQAGLG